MNHTNQLESVRRQVDEAFRTHRVPADEQTCETLLLKDGNYYGRRFSRDRFHAVWVIANDVIEVFGCESELLESLTISNTVAEPLRKAA